MARNHAAQHRLAAIRFVRLSGNIPHAPWYEIWGALTVGVDDVWYGTCLHDIWEN